MVVRGCFFLSFSIVSQTQVKGSGFEAVTPVPVIYLLPLRSRFTQYTMYDSGLHCKHFVYSEHNVKLQHYSTGETLQEEGASQFRCAVSCLFLLTLHG